MKAFKKNFNRLKVINNSNRIRGTNIYLQTSHFHPIHSCPTIQPFSAVTLSRNTVRAAGAERPIGSPLLPPAPPAWRGRRRGKASRWCWMKYGEEEEQEQEEGTVLYGPHLLQNGVSSASSIPHLISPNNLPFSSCPNRESASVLLALSRPPTLTLSFCVCWLVIE